MTNPEWIKEGGFVVVYQEGSQSARTAEKTIIKRVAVHSFTVHSTDVRFRLDDQRTKRQGSSWQGWTMRCVPLDSDEARGLLAARRLIALKAKARDLCEAWIRDSTEAKRQAAVNALNAVALMSAGRRPTEEP